jgi:hypothetical protein
MTVASVVELHHWIPVQGTLLTRGVGFRFCSECDREEWDNGVIRPGHSESKCVLLEKGSLVNEPDNRPLKARGGGILFDIVATVIALLSVALFIGLLAWAVVFVWFHVLRSTG